MFDFNPHTFQIHMQVQENIPADGSVPGRYSGVSVPKWYGLNLRVPDFLSTQNVNNLLALFHFNVGDCQVLPATKVINYQMQETDVDRDCYYIQINASSVEEAKKRALVLAYLTYDLRDHNFVRLNTAQMMENPHIMNKMYKILDNFDIPLIEKEQESDLKALVHTQQKQKHNGFICTEKDSNEMRYHDRFKTMVFREKLIHISIKDEVEERLLDREQILIETMHEQENKKGPIKTDLGLTLFETRKINEQNLKEMKERMQEHIGKRTQEFRSLKTEVKREVQ